MSAGRTLYRVVVCIHRVNAPSWWGTLPGRFRPQRLYRSIPDTTVERNHQIRVLDDLEQEQICSAYSFTPLTVPRASEAALQQAAAGDDWRERVAEVVLGYVLGEAQSGDLRPQFNRHAAVTMTVCPEGLEPLQPVLIDRFLQLSRPIADASKGTTPEMRLSDIGSFIYLVDTVKRTGYGRLEETLCVLLDEFAELEERSYDELYLWCLVELSRTDARHIDTYWPLAMALDARHRDAEWIRPEGVGVFERPHLFTELLFYYCHLYAPQAPQWDVHTGGPYRGPKPPTLGSHLERLRRRLNEEQRTVVRRALEGLVRAEPNRPAFGDALGMRNTSTTERKKRW